LRVQPAWQVQARTPTRTFITAINIVNPAFRMAPRRPLVLEVGRGGAPALPWQLRHKGQTHIFVA